MNASRRAWTARLVAYAVAYVIFTTAALIALNLFRSHP